MLGELSRREKLHLRAEVDEGRFEDVDPVALEAAVREPRSTTMDLIRRYVRAWGMPPGPPEYRGDDEDEWDFTDPDEAVWSDSQFDDLALVLEGEHRASLAEPDGSEEPTEVPPAGASQVEQAPADAPQTPPAGG